MVISMDETKAIKIVARNVRYVAKHADEPVSRWLIEEMMENYGSPGSRFREACRIADRRLVAATIKRDAHAAGELVASLYPLVL